MLDKTEREGGYVYNRQDREEARGGEDIRHIWADGRIWVLDKGGGICI